MDISTGAFLKDRYTILRTLGKGGMGAVYLARDGALNIDVAVKVNLSPAPESSEQFLREARMLANLRHPNLPRVIDYFIDGEAQFLVMDYIPGDDLDMLLKQRGALPPERALAWGEQIGRALSYLHRQNPSIVHRDVKPANIKLTAEGDATLVDFGIAKAASADQPTAAGATGYTPGFAPPEQYGGGRTTPLSDQYALAATIYTLLAGSKPSDAVQRLLGQAVLTPLNLLNPAVPPSVAAALEHALSVRPDERYPSIEAFLAALRGETSGATVVRPASVANIPVAPPVPPAPPPAAPQPQAAPGGRPRWVIPVLIGGALLCVAVSAVLFGGLYVWNNLPAILGQTPTAARMVAVVETPIAEPALATSEPALSASDTPAPTAAPSLTPSPAPSDTPAPSPTPALLGGGGWLVFSSDRGGDGVLQLWRMAVALDDSARPTVAALEPLTTSPGDKTQAAWSPDGTQLLFVAPGANPANGLDIWRMDAEGKQPAVDLTNRKGDETEPAWSPDGQQIAFTVDAREDHVLQLMAMNADGGNPYRLSYDQEESGPAWRPDGQLSFVLNAAGQHILYLREREARPTPTGDPVPPYYVTPVRFDFTTLYGSLGQVAQPAWAPNGSYVAYTRLLSNTQTDVFIARSPVRNEGDVLRLTDTRKDANPTWSPDAQYLAFTSTRDGQPEIYLVRASGSLLGPLAADPARDLDPAWQPQP